MKKIMVIGATGLLGSHLVQLLKSQARPIEVVEVSLNGAGLHVDIANAQSLHRLFHQVGPLDGIACAAGLARFVPWAQTSDDDWAHGIANKLMGQINVIRCGAASVRNGGAITLTTGVLAQYPVPVSAIVTMVNAAVEATVRAAAAELGAGLRINAVSPGWVTETMQAMGMNPTAGMSAKDVAQRLLDQLMSGASGSVLVAARAEV